jgi:hypothetical protein
MSLVNNLDLDDISIILDQKSELYVHGTLFGDDLGRNNK